MVKTKLKVKYNSSDDMPNIRCIKYKDRYYYRITTIKYIKILWIWIPISLKFGIAEDFKRFVSFRIKNEI